MTTRHMIIRHIGLALVFLGLSTIVFSSAVLLADAHGTGGWLEARTGNYILDFDYSLSPLQSNAPVRLDFNVRDSSSGEFVPFSNVWFSLKKDNIQYYNGNIPHSSLGTTGINYYFPEAGTYEAYLRYEVGGSVLAEAPLTVTVFEGTGAGKAASPIGALIAGIAGVIIGFFLSSFIRRG